MQLIDGKEIAKDMLEGLKSKPTPKKILAAVLVHSTSRERVGDDPSLSFIKQKEKTAKELGVDFRVYELDGKLSQDDLREEIGRIAKQGPVGGIIVQLPLPAGVNRHYVVNAIPREKDVDVLGERALGAFYVGRNPVLPPAVGVVEELLKTHDLQLTTKTVAIVGLGFLVGKPIATWLMGQAKEILLFDRGSDFKLLKNADLVITGVGIAGLIKPEMLKEDASLIDFGYGKNGEGKLSGDFDSPSLNADSSKLKASFYTPTPGGTGPILVAKLFENFYALAKEN